ncbi:UNVERIFIED_CONTAM: hypothetical protein GTU68_057528 [Idotea baltica]|nr:hypothetical protein [Idotea baltica]
MHMLFAISDQNSLLLELLSALEFHCLKTWSTPLKNSIKPPKMAPVSASWGG